MPVKIEPLPDAVEDINDVPEKHRSLYVADEAGHGFKYKDPSAAINALRAVKQELTEVKERMASVKDLDPAEYRALKAQKAELEEQRAEIERQKRELPGDFERYKRERDEQAAAKITEVERKTQRVSTKFAQRVVDDTIERTLRAAGVTDDGLELLGPRVRGEISVEWEDDEPTVKVRDSKGRQRFNSEGDPMDMADVIAELKKRHPALFRSSAANGGGGGSTDTGAGADDGRFDKSPSEWPPAKMQKYIKQFGIEAYKNLVREEVAAKRAARNNR